MLGNRPASGTAIIDELGDEHVRTGRPIVYTSADSVFQVACHEDVVPVEQLYEWCAIARRILTGPHAVGRVIARPFAGPPGAYERTPRRRDFSLPPIGPTYLDLLHDQGVPVIGVGKIGEIFTQRGVDVDDHTTDNTAGLAACRRHLETMSHGLLFANLVDFDQTWGHRNDVPGFAAGLREVDDAVPGLLGALSPGRRRHLVRRPRRRSDDGEHRPFARVRAAARQRPARRTLRRPVQRRGATAFARLTGPRAAACRRGHAVSRRPPPAELAVVFGSGLALVPEGAEVLDEIDYRDLGWPATSVAGHPNRLLLARWAPDWARARGGCCWRGGGRISTRAGPTPSSSVPSTTWPTPACAPCC